MRSSNAPPRNRGNSRASRKPRVNHLVTAGVPQWVEPRRAATGPATRTAVRPLVVPLGDGVGDLAGAQPCPVGPRAVGLLRHQVVGTDPGPPDPAGARHPDRVQQPEQPGSIRGLAGRQAGHQRPAPPVADDVDLGRQAAAGAAQRLLGGRGRRRQPPLGRRRRAGGRARRCCRPAPASPAPRPRRRRAARPARCGPRCRRPPSGRTACSRSPTAQTAPAGPATARRSWSAR